LIKFLSLLQKFIFQDLENSRIKIAADRTVPDPQDPDHEDKMRKNTRAASAAGKALRPLLPGIPFKTRVTTNLTGNA
jgi:hypothetical protein